MTYDSLQRQLALWQCRLQGLQAGAFQSDRIVSRAAALKQRTRRDGGWLGRLVSACIGRSERKRLEQLGQLRAQFLGRVDGALADLGAGCWSECCAQAVDSLCRYLDLVSRSDPPGYADSFRAHRQAYVLLEGTVLDLERAGMVARSERPEPSGRLLPEAGQQ